MPSIAGSVSGVCSVCSEPEPVYQGITELTTPSPAANIHADKLKVNSKFLYCFCLSVSRGGAAAASRSGAAAASRGGVTAASRGGAAAASRSGLLLRAFLLLLPS